MAEERERSGGKTDYVWGRHDKHRNMINSTQPHPEPSAHRLPSIASTLPFNPCRDHLYLTSTRFSVSLSSPRPELAPRPSVARFSARSISLPPPLLSSSSWKSFRKGGRKKERNEIGRYALFPPTPTRSGKLATRLWTGPWGRGRGTGDVFFNQRLQSAFVFVGAARDRIKGQTKDGRETRNEAKALLINSADPLSFEDIPWQAYN